ncbi:protein kinase domain-containing protein [Metallosphaera hakonensis]|uniref:Protein kinase domain-containing protein n=1 Tax=Metallosphaera hakonensis JCM 8857 = DSM 7519 TaxID=1293036 RepID=A0A2U9IT33_9CREN|nr:protein kinase [Metallosphaera hakonensis]AWR99113.1 protein kinase [Metallosphaera hakonensis JCM 8857 = DSM 7519]
MERPSVKAIYIIYIIFATYLLTVIFLLQTNSLNIKALLLYISISASLIPLSLPRPNLIVIPVYTIPLFVYPLLSSFSNLDLILTVILSVSAIGLAIFARDLNDISIIPFLISIITFGITYSIVSILLVSSNFYSWDLVLSGITLFIVPVFKAVKKEGAIIAAMVLVLFSQYLIIGPKFNIGDLLTVSMSSVETWTVLFLLASAILISLKARRIVPITYLVLSGLVYLFSSPLLAIFPLQVGSASVSDEGQTLRLDVNVEGNKVNIRFLNPGTVIPVLTVDSSPVKFSCKGKECISLVQATPGKHEVKLCVGNQCVSREVLIRYPVRSPISLDYSVTGNKLQIRVNVAKRVNSLEVRVNNEVVSVLNNGKEYVGEYVLKSAGKYVIEVIGNIKNETITISRELEVKSLNLEIKLRTEPRWPDLIIAAEVYVDGSRSSVDKLLMKVNNEDIAFSNPETGLYTGVITSLEGRTYEIVVEAIKDGIAKTERAKVSISPPSLSSWDPKIWIGKEIYGYDIEGILGVGGTSYVLLGNRESKKYAIKIANVLPSSSGSSTRLGLTTFSDLSKESSKLQEISERANEIVKLYGVYADVNTIREIIEGKTHLYLTNPPAIVMELMRGGTAEDLVKREAVSLSSNWPSVVKIIFINMAKALSAVHRENYVHLDVKPRNIFFSEPPGNTGAEVLNNLLSGKTSVKLGDLGSARRRGERITEYTAEYCPVDQVEDMLLGRGARPDMDVFALGATIYRLINGTPLIPVEVVKDMDGAVDAFLRRGDYRSILEKAKRGYIQTHSSLRLTRFREVEELVRKMTDPDPSKRPSITEILNYLYSI